MHKIIIIAQVKDNSDYGVIRDNLANFPEVIDVKYPVSLPGEGNIILMNEKTSIHNILTSTQMDI